MKEMTKTDIENNKLVAQCAKVVQYIINAVAVTIFLYININNIDINAAHHNYGSTIIVLIVVLAINNFALGLARRQYEQMNEVGELKK